MVILVGFLDSRGSLIPGYALTEDFEKVPGSHRNSLEHFLSSFGIHMPN